VCGGVDSPLLLRVYPRRKKIYRYISFASQNLNLHTSEWRTSRFIHVNESYFMRIKNIKISEELSVALKLQ
jgi:hypothetical protein